MLDLESSLIKGSGIHIFREEGSMEEDIRFDDPYLSSSASEKKRKRKEKKEEGVYGGRYSKVPPSMSHAMRKIYSLNMPSMSHGSQMTSWNCQVTCI